MGWSRRSSRICGSESLYGLATMIKLEKDWKPYRSQKWKEIHLFRYSGEIRSKWLIKKCWDFKHPPYVQLVHDSFPPSFHPQSPIPRRKVDPHTRSVKSGLIWALLCFLRRWTDTPKLFEHLFGRYKVPTILFIANTEVAIETCLSYKGVIAIQTDFPKKFYDVFNRDWRFDIIQ